VFLVPLEREFGWTRSQLTSVYSVYLLVNGFTAPLVGLLFDRMGPRWVYGIGMTCLGTAFFFAAGIVSLWQFYLLVGALVGIGVSMNGMVPASALLARWYKERLPTAIGFAYAAFGAGSLLFVPLAQYIVQEYGWRVAYRAMGTALLMLTVAVVIFIPWGKFAAGAKSARRSAGEDRWTFGAALRTPIFWGLMQVFFCTSVGMFSVIVQLVAYFIHAGFSPLTAASAFGVLGLLSALSVMGSGLLSERFGYRQTITVSFLGTATGMAILLFLDAFASAALLAVFVGAFGLCMGVRGPIVSSVAARHFAGPHVATIYGVIYASNAVGAAIGAFVGGLLHDLTGAYRVGLGFSLTFIVLAALPFWLVPTLRSFR
jgi:MFS family permease